MIYDGNQSAENPYDRLVPLGIAWGNDPGITEEMVSSGKAKLKETLLNSAASQLVTHHGYAGRMAGPVDNPASSCTSCHATAQLVPLSSLAPPDTIPFEERMRWFDNLKRGQSFDKGQTSLDNSLQLVQALENFYAWQGSQITESPSKEQLEGRWFKKPEEQGEEK